MEKPTNSSQGLIFVFFIAILWLDWVYIFSIQQQAPVISHWVVALPLIIPLFFSLTLLAIIGIYLFNPWGFVLAYFTIILSMFFSFISYDSISPKSVVNDLQFVALILLNVIIFIYIVFYNTRCLSDK